MDTAPKLMNIRNATFSSSDGKNVCDTKQLKGEASKDSLSGTNSTVEYSTSQSLERVGGKPGGRPNFG